MRVKIFSLTFLLVVILDQLSKNIILSRFTEGESVVVIPNCFNLVLVFNPGAAFGLFAGFDTPYRQLTIFVVSIVAFGVIALMLKEAKGDLLSNFALSAIMGGAIGNIIDRFRFDSVVDFLDFYIGQMHWPAFNVADSAICIGVFLLVWGMMFCKAPESVCGPKEVIEA